MVFITPKEIVFERAVTLGFAASNNEAEYDALLSRFKTTKKLKIKQLIVHRD